jgi:hypothetical protein
MSNPQERERAEYALADSLIFRHRWWWDPVPDWLIKEIDRNALRELGIAQIQLQRAVIEAQLKAVDQTLAILSKGR